MNAKSNTKPVSQGIVDDEDLLTKDELARKLKLKRRGIENLVSRKVIPVLRVSGRCIRFSWAAVREALARYEIKEVGRK